MTTEKTEKKVTSIADQGATYKTSPGFPIDRFKEFALLTTQEAEKNIGLDRFTAEERCMFYFNNGWEKAMTVARSKFGAKP